MFAETPQRSPPLSSSCTQVSESEGAVFDDEDDEVAHFSASEDEHPAVEEMRAIQQEQEEVKPTPTKLAVSHPRPPPTSCVMLSMLPTI